MSDRQEPTNRDVGARSGTGGSRTARPTELLAFTVSLPFDQRLADDDIAGSRAARPRPACAPASSRRKRPMRSSVRSTRSRSSWPTGTFTFEPTDEDIHTAIERRVTELAGAAGAKLHTGRSRNDQVATALRLYAKRSLTDVARLVLDLQRVLLDRAAEAGPVVPARLHPPAAGAAGAAVAPPARARLGARPRRRSAARVTRAGSTSRRSAPARSPARRSRSTRMASPTTSASRAGSRTRSTR